MTEIRPARAADALRLAGQLAQLGYPSELDAVTSRLTGIVKSATQQILVAGFSGRKAPSSMGKISALGVLRLRAPSSVSHDKSVRRSAQDDGFAASLRCKKPAPSKTSSNTEDRII